MFKDLKQNLKYRRNTPKWERFVYSVFYIYARIKLKVELFFRGDDEV